MTAPTYFTVTGDYRAVVADLLSGTDHDPQLRAITATVTFFPVLASGDLLLATTASPRPTGLFPSPVVARIDSDGRLKLRRFSTVTAAATFSAFPATGNTTTIYYAEATKAHYRWSGSQYVQTFDFAPVRLLADTALLALDGPLYYRVEFSNVKINGADESLNSFTFQAPTNDTEVNLVTVGRAPGQPAEGVVRIAPGAVRAEAGNFIFSFGGVDIPDPVPFPSAIMEYKGVWSAATNTPALANGTGNTGDVYRVSAAGTALSITFDVGDYAIYNGLTWEKSDTTDAVASVAGRTGIVTLAKADVGLSNVDNTSDATKNAAAVALTGKTAVTSTGTVTGSTLVSTVATGTAPLTVASTTQVANLNAQYVQTYTPTTTAAAGSLAARDANANLLARGFIQSLTSTVTSATAVTLTVASNSIQEFTGTLAQTVVLPTTGIVSGQQYTIINNSSAAVTVQSSSLATVATVYGGIDATFTALIATPTTPAHWERTQIDALMVSGYTTNGGLSLNTLAVRDAAGNVTATGFIPGFLSTATAGGTTTLVSNSRSVQEFTGTLAQTVVLPTTSVVAGHQFTIINNSTATVAVQSSGLNAILGIAAGTEATFTALVATPTTAAHWEDSYAVDPVAVQTITNKTLTTPTLTTPVINGQSTGTGVASGHGALTLVQRDGNGHIFAKSLVPTFTSTVASATTVTLITGSNSIQEFTGTSTQTVVLPTSFVSAGWNYTIINNSAGALTVKSSELAAVGAALTTGQSAQFFALVATPTTAAHWHRR